MLIPLGALDHINQPHLSLSNQCFTWSFSLPALSALARVPGMAHAHGTDFGGTPFSGSTRLANGTVADCAGGDV